jgi:hypothetical protein
MRENTAAEAEPSRVRRTTDAAHAGLDVMLSEAAAGGPPRFVAPGAAAMVSVGLARHPGRWWSDWDNWLAERSGELKPAPKALGNRAHKTQAKAPGTYVLAN